MGPSTLFDKSFLQMLTLDEAVIFDLLYSAVICPIFFLEVLADLAKQPTGTSTADQSVSSLARKSPVLHSYPNQLHTHLCLRELLGDEIAMDCRPVIPRGQVRIDRGKISIINERPAEMVAFDRWTTGGFESVERDFASKWRADLKGLDNARLAQEVLRLTRISELPKSHEDALKLADNFLDLENRNFQLLTIAYDLLNIDRSFFDVVIERWKKSGRPPLRIFAPYVTYCLKVEIFFNLCLAKRLVSPDRPSNRTDAAYLFYLPFAKVFVSNDNLHKRTAPLFLRQDQMFVAGDHLKKDLQQLIGYVDGNYSEAEIEEKGLFSIFTAPPEDGQYLTTKIWGHFNLRFETPPKSKPSSELTGRVLKMISDAQKGRPVASHLATSDNADFLMLKRSFPQKMGKWAIVPKGSV